MGYDVVREHARAGRTVVQLEAPNKPRRYVRMDSLKLLGSVTDGPGARWDVVTDGIDELWAATDRQGAADVALVREVDGEYVVCGWAVAMPKGSYAKRKREDEKP